MKKKFFDSYREMKSRFKTLFENMEEGVVFHSLTFDETGNAVNYTIEEVNSGFEKILNLKKASVKGRLATEVYGVSEPPFLKEYVQTVISGDSKIFQTYFPPLSKHFSISVSKWGDKGFITIFSDITAAKENEKQIQALLEEKSLLLKELHHRVTNNISAVCNLLMLQAQSVDNPEASSILTDARNRLKSMGLLHNRLYSSDAIENCNVTEYVSLLADEILTVFPNGSKVKIYKNIDNFCISQKILFSIGLIVNELLTNALKYAFEEIENPRITISLEKSDSLISLSVEDNGIGFQDTSDAKPYVGFGLSLVNLITEQLKGNLDIECRNGTIVTLSFHI